MIKAYLEAAVEIAREAGKVLREELERPPAIAYKGEFDLVTQADRRSESVIVSGAPPGPIRWSSSWRRGRAAAVPSGLTTTRILP